MNTHSHECLYHTSIDEHYITKKMQTKSLTTTCDVGDHTNNNDEEALEKKYGKTYIDPHVRS